MKISRILIYSVAAATSYSVAIAAFFKLNLQVHISYVNTVANNNEIVDNNLTKSSSKKVTPTFLSLFKKMKNEKKVQ